MTLPVDYPVIVDSARIIAASLTVGTVVPVLTTNHMGRTLLVANTLDADVWLTLNGANWMPFPAQQGGGMDGVRITIPVASVLGVIPISGSPTTGWLGLVNV